MEKQRWEAVQETFHNARSLDGDARSSFLAEVEDADLRSTVEALLEAERAEEGLFPDSPLVGQLPLPERAGLAGGDDEDEPRLPKRYRAVERIGSGGMAHVYRAERCDGEYEQVVAAKVIKRGMDSAALLERFRRERETLARLQHPHIARLLDGGTLEDGRPFLVMEHVDGIPITEYCEHHELDPRDRVRLFLQVVDAVHFAHQRLVVHRDLKPENILVDASGEVKLLDFGIAKLLDDSTPNITRVGFAPLTVEYASPEQLRGEPITTACDIYALGVVLYRLLTGHPPYDVEGCWRREAERIVCEQDPPRASTAVRRWALARASETDPGERRDAEKDRARRVRRALRGDLDAILLRALRKRPAHRYGSAQQLAEDLRHHLRGEVVGARSGSAAYRMTRFARRHRAVFVAAAIFVITALAGTLTTLWKARVAAEQRDEAVLAQERLGRVNEILQDILRAPDPARDGRDVTVHEMLISASERLGEGLEDDPEIEAVVRTTIGRTHLGLGDYARARAEFERAYQLRAGSEESDPAALAESVNNLAVLHYTEGDMKGAVSLLERAVELNRRAHGDLDADVAQSLNNLAAACRADKQIDRALAASREALRIREQLLGPDSLEVAESLNNLANLSRSLGRDAEAREQLARSLAIRRAHLPPDHPLLLQSLSNLAVLRMGAGDLDGAEPLLRESLARSLANLGPDHVDLAYPLTHLGELLRMRGKHGEAVTALEEALRLRRAGYPAGHRQTAGTAALLGLELHALGDDETAVPLLEANVEIIAEWFGESHDRTRAVRRALGEIRGEHAAGSQNTAKPIPIAAR